MMRLEIRGEKKKKKETKKQKKQMKFLQRCHTNNVVIIIPNLLPCQ